MPRSSLPLNLKKLPISQARSHEGALGDNCPQIPPPQKKNNKSEQTQLLTAVILAYNAR